MRVWMVVVSLAAFLSLALSIFTMVRDGGDGRTIVQTSDPWNLTDVTGASPTEKPDSCPQGTVTTVEMVVTGDKYFVRWIDNVGRDHSLYLASTIVKSRGIHPGSVFDPCSLAD